VRGAAHGADLEVMLRHGAAMLVAPGRGYALVSGGAVRLVAAHDEPAAADLLRAAIATTPEGGRADVMWISSAQQRWALPVVLEAGLELRPGGAVFLRGEVGPFRPYLPTGAYL
ncbi:MAG: GNAT family N-acetyltransferase, partial [Actinomycetota bacterium]|nr:GNAT family N-acetyltransferase [Actinomycetota bacterium]